VPRNCVAHGASAVANDAESALAVGFVVVGSGEVRERRLQTRKPAKSAMSRRTPVIGPMMTPVEVLCC
jgi:hypothetical protein